MWRYAEQRLGEEALVMEIFTHKAQVTRVAVVDGSPVGPPIDLLTDFNLKRA